MIERNTSLLLPEMIQNHQQRSNYVSAILFKYHRNSWDIMINIFEVFILGLVERPGRPGRSTSLVTRLAWSLHQLGNQAGLVAPLAR